MPSARFALHEWWAVCRGLTAALVVLVGSTVAGPEARAQDEGAPPFRPAQALDLAALEQAVQLGWAELAVSRGETARARALIRQSRMFDNPTLDATWGTIPLGKLNPPELEHPLANVPYYDVGLAYTIPVRKRAPRKEQALHYARGTDARYEADVRSGALELARVLGELASATLRHRGMLELTSQGKRSVELAEARLRTGLGTPLDLDRLSLEISRGEQALLGVEADMQTALAACEALVGRRCVGFDDEASARAFLAHWIARDVPTSPALEERPDLRALEAHAQAFGSEARLARAEALPDPTVRLGYTHDRFLISGNQRNSVSLSVSLPLPLFDRGEAREQAALAGRDALLAERDKRMSTTLARIPTLTERLALLRGRCQRVEAELVPRARTVLENLERAAESRLLPLTDVIQARRTMFELLVDEADSCGDAYAAAVELAAETSWAEGPLGDRS